MPYVLNEVMTNVTNRGVDVHGWVNILHCLQLHRRIRWFFENHVSSFEFFWTHTIDFVLCKLNFEVELRSWTSKLRIELIQNCNFLGKVRPRLVAGRWDLIWVHSVVRILRSSISDISEMGDQFWDYFFSTHMIDSVLWEFEIRSSILDISELRQVSIGPWVINFEIFGFHAHDRIHVVRKWTSKFNFEVHFWIFGEQCLIFSIIIEFYFLK